MKVLVFPAGQDDNDATSQYRLLLPAAALAAQGFDVESSRRPIQILWSEEWHPDLMHPPPHVHAMALAEKPDADVVVIQRPGRRFWSEIIPMLQALGIRVVVDVDDAFGHIRRDHASYAEYETPNVNWRWIERACRLADQVTVTTPFLMGEYGFGHGHVLPNLVPERYLSVEADKDVESIGWSGRPDTHPGDLEVTGGAVNRVCHETGWHVRVVGTGAGVRDALKLVYPPLTSDGWVPFVDYPAELGRIGIGIVPLSGCAFNRGKSYLKMMEFAALGVPVVASPTPDNQRLHKRGVGVLADTRNQWQRRLKALVANPEYRSDVVGRGLDVVKTMTYEAHADRWWQVWTGQSA